MSKGCQKVSTKITFSKVSTKIFFSKVSTRKRLPRKIYKEKTPICDACVSIVHSLFPT
jgi:hypothetical protein